MAKINITGGRVKHWYLCSECKGGRVKHWYLCSECKGSDVGGSATEIVELAKAHLVEAHTPSTRTHRIELDMDHLIALTNAARTAGEADAEGVL